VDEAAQAMEAESLIPIARYLGKNSRLILTGDHKQLGPVITARFLKNFPNAYDSMINRLVCEYSNIYNNDG
jgi:superfamily I DNA and/or RNA helicase